MNDQFSIALIVFAVALLAYGYVGILSAIMGGWRVFAVLAGCLTFMFACAGIMALGVWGLSRRSQMSRINIEIEADTDNTFDEAQLNTVAEDVRNLLLKHAIDACVEVEFTSTVAGSVYPPICGDCDELKKYCTCSDELVYEPGAFE